MHRSTTWLAASAALVALARGADAQDTTRRASPAPSPPSVGRILGVFDDQSGQPLADVEIVDLLTGSSFRTQASGLIGLAGFARQHDSAAVRIRKLGFSDTSFVVMLGIADTTPVQVFLRRATQLDAVISSAPSDAGLTGNMREFAGRMRDKTLHGKYVTPAQLPPNDPRRLGDVLFDIGFGRGTLRCAHGLRIFINGRQSTVVSTDDWGAVPIDLKEPAVHYEAIEYYPGSGPLEYGGCSLLLWTRGS